MASVGASVQIDRGSDVVNVYVDYFIEAYVDEYGQNFSDTSWGASLSEIGGPGGASWSGTSGESGSAPLDIAFDMAPGVKHFTLSFGAQNVTSAVSVTLTYDLFLGALDTADATVLATATQDIIVTGSGADVIRAYGGDDHIDAGAGDDTIEAGLGADFIDGGAGADLMAGGDGNDSYVVDDVDDVITETASGGADSAVTSVTYVFGANVEIISLDGLAGAIGATGNASANVMSGNESGNALSGLGGHDALHGFGGNDTLLGGEDNDTLSGSGGVDRLSGGAGNDLYVDPLGDVVTEAAGEGTDTVESVTNYVLPQNVEILTLTGLASTRGTGNAAANTINGNDAANLLSGAGGNDILNGGLGADTLIGGASNDNLVGGLGADTAEYTGSAAVAINLQTLAVGGGDAAGDVFSGIENVTGTAFADTLTGDGAANILKGAEGNDTLSGGLGADTIVGGTGADALDGGDQIDTVSYAGSTSAVLLNLATLVVSGGDAQGDTIANFESATGGSGADTLTGNAAANVLMGGLGADTITGGSGSDSIFGQGGADMLDGGVGDFDTLSYAGSVAGVVVNLVMQTVASGDAAGDTIANFENATGGNGNDRMWGNTGSNTLAGGGGADTLDGGAGNDLVLGGAGGDTLIGGVGTGDTLSYAGSTATVGINLAFSWAFGGDAEGDTISGFENVIGSESNDSLTGGDGANRITGRAGFDSLDGGLGNDVLTGGTQHDTFYFNAGRDLITDFEIDGHDVVLLQLGDAFDTFAEVMAKASQVGANTVIAFSADNVLTMQNIVKAELTMGDFGLAG